MTRVSRHFDAPRSRVYEAFLDADAIARWKVPDGMTSEVHSFEGREGGTFRISLTYEAPGRQGKTAANTDTYRGRFERLLPNEQIVEIDEFESDDPLLQGEMRITVTLQDAPGGGTDLVATHDGLPPGVAPADNELGWQLSLNKLATLVQK